MARARVYSPSPVRVSVFAAEDDDDDDDEGRESSLPTSLKKRHAPSPPAPIVAPRTTGAHPVSQSRLNRSAPLKVNRRDPPASTTLLTTKRERSWAILLCRARASAELLVELRAG